MTLSLILEALYSDNEMRVIEMINYAHPTKSHVLKEKHFVIHSGFRFLIYQDKLCDVLIDLSDFNNPALILSPISKQISFPLILGLVIFRKNKYLDAFSKVLIAGISEDTIKIYPLELPLVDIVIENLSHSEFFIFNSIDNSIIKRFPLSRIYDKSLVFNNGKFSLLEK